MRTQAEAMKTVVRYIVQTTSARVKKEKNWGNREKKVTFPKGVGKTPRRNHPAGNPREGRSVNRAFESTTAEELSEDLIEESNTQDIMHSMTSMKLREALKIYPSLKDAILQSKTTTKKTTFQLPYR
ncbi:hypothetical protein NPIL_411141 [Nephila pilipes]|uniref:Uncharacterized protein n=1 Tax=Nephila pilipes TaxID=299642 RepID=A0A8X6IK65_NEPPI|nr:hypothetical protein NPIL_411141 [Nephila pilipes]